MLDMGWTEILVIGVVALIVVGPKDLPRMLRTLGQYAGKMRGMAREFQRSMDDAAREADLAELKDVGNALNDVRKIQSDAKGAITQGLAKIDREIDEAADLEEKSTPVPEPRKVEDPLKSFTSSSGPVDKPDLAAAQASADPAPEAAETIPEKTASSG
ncbi:MAG: Sec-independent protein translocase protein TatB [Pseudomonadota bacterium]